MVSKTGSTNRNTSVRASPGATIGAAVVVKAMVLAPGGTENVTSTFVPFGPASICMLCEGKAILSVLGPPAIMTVARSRTERVEPLALFNSRIEEPALHRQRWVAFDSNIENPDPYVACTALTSAR